MLAAVSRPISKGLAPRAVAATRGIRTVPMTLPNWAVVSPAQRSRKSWWCQRLLPFTRGDLSPPPGDGQPPVLAWHLVRWAERRLRGREVAARLSTGRAGRGGRGMRGGREAGGRSPARRRRTVGPPARARAHRRGAGGNGPSRTRPRCSTRPESRQGGFPGAGLGRGRARPRRCPPASARPSWARSRVLGTGSGCRHRGRRPSTRRAAGRGSSDWLTSSPSADRDPVRAAATAASPGTRTTDRPAAARPGRGWCRLGRRPSVPGPGAPAPEPLPRPPEPSSPTPGGTNPPRERKKGGQPWDDGRV